MLGIRDHFVQRLGSINDDMLGLTANKREVCPYLPRGLFGGHLLLARLQHIRWSIQQDPQFRPWHQRPDQSRRPHGSSKAKAYGVNQEVMIIAVADQQGPALLLKKSEEPFLHEPDRDLYQRKKGSSRRHSMRINDDGDWLAAQLRHHARLEVAHLHSQPSRIQSLHQSADYGALAGSVGTKQYDFQFENLLELQTSDAVDTHAVAARNAGPAPASQLSIERERVTKSS